jgi:pentatricopeptide repeat protein
VTTRRDERLSVLAAAVLRGDPDAADALHRRMQERGVDPVPLRRRAEEGLAATQAELDDLLRQLREGSGGNHLVAQAAGVLKERAGWWRLLDVARRIEAGG